MALLAGKGVEMDVAAMQAMSDVAVWAVRCGGMVGRRV